MKTTRPTLLVVSLLSLPCVAHATDIYQTHYSYSFEVIACAPRLAFVICDDNCTAASSLLRAPKAVTLSARISQGDAGGHVPKAVVTGTVANIDASKKADGYETSALPPLPREGMARRPTSVLFGLNSFALQASEEANLFALVAEVKSHKNVSVSVEGYTCDLGSQAHNDILAKKRAETVAAYLEKDGIHPARVTAAGKCCYTTEDPLRRSLNRRVEITVSTGENR